jgi:hypothetical protein
MLTQLLAIFGLSLCASVALGKGLQKIVDENPANQPEEVTAPAEPAKTPIDEGEGEEIDDDDKAKDEKGEDAEKADEDEKAKKHEVKPVVAERSEISKKLDGKIFLRTTINRAFLSGTGGEWKGSGMSDIKVGYLLPVSLLPKSQLWGTFRYAPFDATVITDDFTYRGSVESYLPGAVFKFSLSDGMVLFGSFELGYAVVHFEDSDGLDGTDGPDGNGVMVGLGAGLDFKIGEKLLAGPHLDIGAGTATLVALGGGVSLVF